MRYFNLISPILTYFINLTSGKRFAQWHKSATIRRCDICRVGLSSIANDWALSLLYISCWMTESKCNIIQAKRVRLHLGSCSSSCCNSFCCSVTLGCEATSSNRATKSVVSIGSGNSRMNNLSRLQAVGTLSSSLEASNSRLLYRRL